MGKPGIFNPYKVVEKPKAPEPTNPSVRLDGDSYILEFLDVSLNDIPIRLGEIISEVQQQYPEQLLQNGIELRDRKTPLQVETDELVLPTPKGHLVVYVGQGGREIDAFRRLGFILNKLPVTPVLAKHKTKIITRL